MRIISFSAISVHGSFSPNLVFDKNPAILIAPNGAGKTTALKLLQALLTPSLTFLLETKFISAEVQVEEAGKLKSIHAKKPKNGSSLSVTHSDVNGELTIPTALISEIGGDIPSYKRTYEIERSLRVKYGDNPVFLAITDLAKPVFLGLDRLSRSSYADEALITRSAGGHLARGITTNTGLTEIERLIRKAYRMMRTIKDAQSERLKSELIFNGFEYTSISASELNDTLNVRDYFDPAKLKRQREDLFRAMHSIGIEESKSGGAISGFFNKADELSAEIERRQEESGMDAEIMFEAIINRFALRRFENLVSRIQSNTRHLGITKKLTSFVEDVNSFFRDSKKEVSIDPVGQIKITSTSSAGNREEIGVEQLSSGEQQLLIMFSHLHFNSFGDKSSVFVFDEPEVSLHLKWQELLLPTMLRSSPKAQLLIATHSPEIVGELLDNCKDIAYA